MDAPPLGRATLTVVWEAKGLLKKRADGTWRYALTWLRVPDHRGDTLALRVDLPKGWKWKAAPPPSRLELDRDVRDDWAIER